MRRKTITKKKQKKSDDKYPNVVESDLGERLLQHKDAKNKIS